MLHHEQSQLIKIAVFGDTGTGKTNLIRRYCGKTFIEETKATIASDFSRRPIHQGAHTFDLQIWDTSGNERFFDLAIGHIRSARCCMIVFDMTRRYTFEAVPMWIEKARHHLALDDDSIIIVGNKSDEVDKRDVTTEELLTFAKEVGCKAVETSAKDNTYVEEAFGRLTKSLITSIILESQEKEREEYCGRLAEEANKKKNTVLNIKQYILDNLSSFSVYWPSGSLIKLDNGDEARVATHVALHWEEIKTAENNGLLVSFETALKKIEKISHHALEKPSYSDQSPFAISYYERVIAFGRPDSFSHARPAGESQQTNTTSTTTTTTHTEPVITRRYKKPVKPAQAKPQQAALFTPPTIQPPVEQAEQNPEPPESFLCSITGELMTDPVILEESEQTYEREAISKWLSEHDTDPNTRIHITNKKLILNRALKDSIEDWRQKNLPAQASSSTSLKK